MISLALFLVIFYIYFIVRSDMLLLNALTVLQKVIQSLPNFVSPYLKSILVQVNFGLVYEINCDYYYCYN